MRPDLKAAGGVLISDSYNKLDVDCAGLDETLSSQYDELSYADDDLTTDFPIAKIINSGGKAVYSKTKKPGTTIYSLYNFDNSMLFGKLSAGTYTYKITAKDSHGKTVTVKHGFTVSKDGATSIARSCTVSDKSTAASPARPATDPASTLRGVKLNYPKKIKKGKRFTIKGKVKSNYPLTKVVVTIKTKKGAKKQSVTGWCKGAKAYSLKNIDDDVKFGKLKKGTYYYIVSARDSKKSKRLLKKKFIVR